MRILFLTTQLPYPPVSGGVIKSWRLINHFAKKHEVHLVCPLKNDDADHLPAFSEALPEVEVFAVPVARPRTPLNLVRSYLVSDTLNIYRNFDARLEKKAKEIAERADLIFVDHYETGQFVPRETRAKVVLHEHNAEYVMWERLAEIEPQPIKKTVLRAEAARIKRTERKYARRADLVLAAPNDILELKKIGVPEEKMKVTYHLGEDEMLELPDTEFSETEKALIFIGTLTWEANVDGLLWFLKEVWPEVLEREPETRFYIIGKNPDERIVRAVADAPNITLTGFVRDLEPYHRKGRVFVIPLRFGSGIKVKLLNALYRGIPVVTTPIGTEGLQITSGSELYCTVSASEQADHIVTLLTDRAKWKSMQKAARGAARKYSWAALLEAHDRDLEQLLS